MPLIPSTWLNSLTVNTTTPGTQNQPDIAQLANGNILVTWDSYSDTGVGSPDGADVLGQLFDPMGTRIGTEFLINAASTSEDERDSDIVALPGGGFIVIYHADDFQAVGGSNIMLEEFSATGAPVSEIAVVVQDSGIGAFPNYANPRGAAASDTSVLVVYEKSSALGASGIFGKVYDPTTNTYSSEIAVISGEGNRSAELTVLSNGTYAIVANRSETAGGGDNSLFFRVLDATGANVIAQTIVSGTDTNGANDTEVSITALTGGGFVLAWSSVNGADTDVLYRVYSNAGAELASGVTGSTLAADDNNEPAVTSLTDGSFVIAYDDDVNDTLHATHYSAAGVNLGDFVFATTGTEISVTDLADGRLAVTYLSEGGEIQMEILDTRDAPNATGVYTPAQWQVGTAGNDVFTAAANAATIHGHTGNDTITDGLGANTIFGDSGNDRINVTGVIDTDAYFGGIGNDFINWSANTNGNGIVFNLALGTAVLGAGSEVMGGFEHLIGTAGNDTINGTALANSLIGGSGNDTINGDAGNDVLNGGTGNDVLTGGLGNDLFIVDSASDVINEGTGQGTSDWVAASVSFVLAADDNIERLSTTSLAGLATINLKGNALSQTITGNAGTNTLNDGGGAADRLIGNLGNDTYIVGNARTIIDEGIGQGINDLVATSVSFVLAADDNIERLSTTSSLGLAAINLTGNAFAQRITGNAGANRIEDGLGVADTLVGGTGNDTYVVRNAGTLIVEGTGGGTNDGVFAAVSFVLAADDNIELLATTSVAGTTAINLTGNAFAQRIFGNAAANRLESGAGAADTLIGGGGNDTYFVRNSGTLIVENTGFGTADSVGTSVSFTLAADDNIEFLSAIPATGTTAINLTGNALGQGITGNSGANRIDGKGGNDILTGGAGADVFVFTTALAATNIDRIAGYDRVSDQIEIDNAVFTGMIDTNTILAAQAYTFNTTGLATQGTHRIIYETDTGFLWFDQDGSGTTFAAKHFATVAIGTALSASEFTVI